MILFDAEYLRQAVLISEAPSGPRDGPIERSTRRGFPYYGVTGVAFALVRSKTLAIATSSVAV